MRREGDYTILPGCQPAALQGGLCLLMLIRGLPQSPLLSEPGWGL